MKFTIESFKTHIYRPAEWMIENDKISHLIGDLNKQFSLSLEEFKFDSISDSAGETFSIKVIYNNCLPSAKKFKVSEIEILTVKFLNTSSDEYTKRWHDHCKRDNGKEINGRNLKNIDDFIYNKIVFEDDFEKLINETKLPYWTTSMLLKKINALVFKVLTDMQEYEDKSPIVVDPKDTETE